MKTCCWEKPFTKPHILYVHIYIKCLELANLWVKFRLLRTEIGECRGKWCAELWGAPADVLGEDDWNLWALYNSEYSLNHWIVYLSIRTFCNMWLVSQIHFNKWSRVMHCGLWIDITDPETHVFISLKLDAFESQWHPNELSAS